MQLTLKQAADVLHLSTTMTKRLIENRTIPAIVTPHAHGRSTYRIDDGALRAYQKAQRQINGHAVKPEIVSDAAPAATSQLETSAMLKRVSDVKKELGISDAFVYDRIKKGRIQVAAKDGNGRMMLDQAAIDILKQDKQERLRKLGAVVPPVVTPTMPVSPTGAAINIPLPSSLLARAQERENEIKHLHAKCDAFQRALIQLQGRVEEIVTALGGI